jgi:TRAF3-interacting protein 1
MGDLNELIPNVISFISSIIQKPKMSDKLLSKPPFKFLHDTISAITVATGFAEGLYSPSELDSGAITDRQAKIDYLEKIFNLVGICVGQQIDIRAAKVVAGLEPECTNSFLLLLGQCATSSSIDFQAAVNRTLSGENPGSGRIPTKGTAAQAKSEFKDPSG